MTVTEIHPPTGPAGEPTMVELEAWVVEWFTEILERRASNRRRWCVRWWEHSEAVCRMWILFHGHRQVVEHGDALAMSSWMLDHLDRHLDALQSENGPFAGCTVDRHSRHCGLSVEPTDRWSR